MLELHVNDFRAINASTLTLHGKGREATFTARLQASIASLISADVTALECFTPDHSWTGRMFADPGPLVTCLFDIFLKERLSHPLFPLFVTGRLRKPVCISEVTPLRELQQKAIYSEFLRPLGIDRQIGVALRCKDGVAGVLILGRKSLDFTQTDKNRLEAFLPHIELAMETNADTHIHRRSATNATRLQERHPHTPGVTKREAEIAWWLANGKTDGEIADICGLGKRTVQKHCENLYRKLGVECRTAAVVRLFEVGL